MTIRNIKMFFKDKGMLLTSLITPLILLILYSTFLGKTFKDSYAEMFKALPPGVDVPSNLVDSLVAAQILSSMLAVSCVTVAFCCNMLMVQDKISGSRMDFTVSPLSRSKLALSYYISTIVSTAIVCFVAIVLCLAYVKSQGWYYTAEDVVRIVLDTMLMVLFGTALSSVVNVFLTSNGQVSAVGTIVSAGYGFICGAYMPISQFGEKLKNALCLFPGIHGTSILRRASMSGVFRELEADDAPKEFVKALKDLLDCNVYYSGDKVSAETQYFVLAGTTIALIIIYVIITKHQQRH
ncbi:MAG: ABC transporter permease [Eubacteriales bacterium]|nr:ABC transporter permease [Eubacteriales bacterium]